MISVIVPVYNVKAYLKEAIESLLYQTYPDIEIILVDDGSTDGSGAICDCYREKDNRIKVIHQCNRGLSAARNAGLDLASGEYIAFLDGDDAFCQEALYQMEKAMKTYHAELVECNFAIFYGDQAMNAQVISTQQKGIRTRQSRTGLYCVQEAVLLQCEGKLANYVWNKLYHRSIWENLRFREGQNYEDLDLILPILTAARHIYVLDEPLVMYRKREGSITKTKSYTNMMDHELAYRHYFAFAETNAAACFTEGAKRKILEKRTRFLYAQFFNYAGSTIVDREECLAYLRGQITENKKRISIRSCPIMLRGADFLYTYSPLFLSVAIYKMIKLLHAFAKKVL